MVLTLRGPPCSLMVSIGLRAWNRPNYIHTFYIILMPQPAQAKLWPEYFTFCTLFSSTNTRHTLDTITSNLYTWHTCLTSRYLPQGVLAVVLMAETQGQASVCPLIHLILANAHSLYKA